jgi:hypothetical protein
MFQLNFVDEEWTSDHTLCLTDILRYAPSVTVFYSSVPGGAEWQVAHSLPNVHWQKNKAKRRIQKPKYIGTVTRHDGFLSFD